MHMTRYLSSSSRRSTGNRLANRRALKPAQSSPITLKTILKAELDTKPSSERYCSCTWFNTAKLWLQAKMYCSRADYIQTHVVHGINVIRRTSTEELRQRTERRACMRGRYALNHQNGRACIRLYAALERSVDTFPLHWFMHANSQTG